MANLLEAAMDEKEMQLWTRYAVTHVSMLLDSAINNGWPEEDVAFENKTEALEFVRECVQVISRKYASKGLNKKDLITLGKLRGKSVKEDCVTRCSECGAIRSESTDDGIKCPNCESA
jgi:hypothetical protein